MPEAETSLNRPASRPSQAPAVIFAVLAALLPLLAVYGPKLTVVPAAAALCGLFFLRERPALPAATAVAPLALLVLLVLWAGASTLWSADPDRSLRAALAVAAILAGALGLLMIAGSARDSAGIVGRGLVAGLVLAMLACAFEYLSGGAGLIWLKGLKPNPEEQFSLLNRGLAVLALLVWPAALWLYRRGRVWMAPLLLAAAMVIVVLGNGVSIKLALGAGLLAAVLAAMAARFALRAFAVVVVIGLLVTPLIPSQLVRHVDPASGGASSESLGHRLVIWQFTAERIAERPILGWGLDAARSIPGADARAVIRTEPTVRQAAVLPNHPHNGALQVWLELGSVGAVLLAIAFVAVALMLERRLPGRWERAAVIGQLTTGVAIACLSFGLWQAWWLVALALVAAITRVLAVPQRPAIRA